jgi:Arc/MetJ-type ribon-helix-helix transcriptional regulator
MKMPWEEWPYTMLPKSMILLDDNLYASKVGSQMVALFSELGYDDARATNMLLDVYGGKAPRTINKRIGALRRCVIWARKRSSGRSAFPLEEPVAHDYLCYLRKEGASTAPASFMGAVNFGFYVLGIEGGDLVSASERAKGVAPMQSAAKRHAAQRHPHTIQQASALEEMVTRAPTVQDRNLAGFCTFLCLSRARFSDAMHGKAILDDMQADPRTLGCYIASDETSCLAFGRDNQSEPLRWVERVLEAIRSGEFVPDQTRSGRFKEGSDPINKAKEMFTTRAMTKPAKIDALEPVLPVVVEVDKKSQDSASSSSSNDSATSEETANLLQNEERR